MRQDEDKIKELSNQQEEKNMKIIELQKELREVRSDKLSNEAKMLELRDQLAESRNSFNSLKRNMETAVQGKLWLPGFTITLKARYQEATFYQISQE